MNRNDLITKTQDKIEELYKYRPAKDIITEIIVSTFEAIEDCVAKGEKVKVKGFGVFELKTNKSRNCKLPYATESIVLPERITAKFRVGVDFANKIKAEREK